MGGAVIADADEIEGLEVIGRRASEGEDEATGAVDVFGFADAPGDEGAEFRAKVGEFLEVGMEGLGEEPATAEEDVGLQRSGVQGEDVGGVCAWEREVAEGRAEPVPDVGFVCAEDVGEGHFSGPPSGREKGFPSLRVERCPGGPGGLVGRLGRGPPESVG